VRKAHLRMFLQKKKIEKEQQTKIKQWDLTEFYIDFGAVNKFYIGIK
jgi:hypothetical protein